HTRLVSDWSSDVCSSDLGFGRMGRIGAESPHPHIHDNARRAETTDPGDEACGPCDRRNRPRDEAVGGMRRLLRYFRARHFERELATELQAHLDEKTDELIDEHAAR